MSFPFAVAIRGYGTIAKETTPGTPVKPTAAFYYETADVMTGYESENVPVAANSRSLNLLIAKGKNAAPTGTISMPVQMPSIGHFLSGSFGLPASTGPTDLLYSHAFTSGAAGTIPTYTLDIQNGDTGYVERYVSCRFGGVKFSQKYNIWWAELTVMARYSFISAKLTANTLALATAFPIDSNHGLTTSDTVIVGLGTANEESLTVTTVNTNGTDLVLSAATKAHTADDLIVIKAYSPSYSTASNTFEWQGGTTTSLGTTLAGVAQVATLQEFGLDISQGLEPIYAPNGTGDFGRFPTEIAVKGYGSTASTKVIHSGQQFSQWIKDRQDLAFAITSVGNLVGTTSRDTFQVQVPSMRINPRGLTQGGDTILNETLAGSCEYNATSGFDVKVIIKNATASY